MPHLCYKASLAIIGLQIIWVAVDTDFNNEDLLVKSDAIFQLAEHFFCTYFAVEVLVRFGCDFHAPALAH